MHISNSSSLSFCLDREPVCDHLSYTSFFLMWKNVYEVYTWDYWLLSLAQIGLEVSQQQFHRFVMGLKSGYLTFRFLLKPSADLAVRFRRLSNLNPLTCSCGTQSRFFSVAATSLHLYKCPTPSCWKQYNAAIAICKSAGLDKWFFPLMLTDSLHPFRTSVAIYWKSLSSFSSDMKY